MILVSLSPMRIVLFTGNIGQDAVEMFSMPNSSAILQQDFDERTILPVMMERAKQSLCNFLASIGDMRRTIGLNAFKQLQPPFHLGENVDPALCDHLTKWTPCNTKASVPAAKHIQLAFHPIIENLRLLSAPIALTRPIRLAQTLLLREHS